MCSTRYCRYCNMPFEPPTAWHYYCGDVCQEASHAEQRQALLAAVNSWVEMTAEARAGKDPWAWLARRATESLHRNFAISPAWAKFELQDEPLMRVQR